MTLSRVLIEGELVGGLVGFAQNTGVSSIRMLRGLVKGSGDSAGGLIGNFVSGGSMRNVSSSVTVEGIDNVGGLIGYAEGNMINSSASGSVTGSGQYTGGLIGQHSSGIIVNSFGTGTVSGGDFTGGLVGTSRSHSVGEGIRNSYSKSPIVSGQDSVGGLSGGSSGGNIHNTYAAGSIVRGSGNNVGGLVGNNFGGEIKNSYSRSSVKLTHDTNSNVGGLIGNNNSGQIIGTNYFVDRDGSTHGIGGGTSTCETGAVCEHRGSIDIGKTGIDQSFPAPLDWLSSNWSYGALDRLPALRYIDNPSRGARNASNRWCDDLDGSGDDDDDDPEMPNCGSLLAGQPFIAPFASGEGTEDDPYVIKNYEQLNNVRYYMSSDFILANNIDASESCNSDSNGDCQGEGWEPIGKASAYRTLETFFAGTFDGKNHEISNLYSNRPTLNGVALFGVAGSIGDLSGREVVIQNLVLVDPRITGGAHVSALVGWNGGSFILNTHVKTRENAPVEEKCSLEAVVTHDLGGIVGWNERGTIAYTSVECTLRGRSSIGGIVGYNEGIISNSHSKVKILGDSYFVAGGLVGYNQTAIYDSSSEGSFEFPNGERDIEQIGGLVGDNTGWISRCHSSVSIVANDSGAGISSVGGLIGNAWSGKVAHSYSTGSVMGENHVGGLIGLATTGSIVNSYSTGSVIGEDYVGGLVGKNDGGNVISNSYTTAPSVEGNDYVGGLVGKNDGDISNSYSTVQLREIIM